MRKKKIEFSNQPYSRILISNDDGTYTAEVLEFPGCVAQGNSAEEANQNLESAAQSWIDVANERGLNIPPPYLNQDYSGHIALRLPRSLHRQAARLAERDGVSLNQFLVTAVAGRLGAEDLFTQLCDRFEQRLVTTAANIALNSNWVVKVSSNSPPSLKAHFPLIDAPINTRENAEVING